MSIYDKVNIVDEFVQLTICIYFFFQIVRVGTGYRFWGNKKKKIAGGFYIGRICRSDCVISIITSKDCWRFWAHYFEYNFAMVSKWKLLFEKFHN